MKARPQNWPHNRARGSSTRFIAHLWSLLPLQVLLAFRCMADRGGQSKNKPINQSSVLPFFRICLRMQINHFPTCIRSNGLDSRCFEWWKTCQQVLGGDHINSWLHIFHQCDLRRDATVYIIDGSTIQKWDSARKKSGKKKRTGVGKHFDRDMPCVIHVVPSMYV